MATLAFTPFPYTASAEFSDLPLEFTNALAGTVGRYGLDEKKWIPEMHSILLQFLADPEIAATIHEKALSIFFPLLDLLPNEIKKVDLPPSIVAVTDPATFTVLYEKGAVKTTAKAIAELFKKNNIAAEENKPGVINAYFDHVGMVQVRLTEIP